MIALSANTAPLLHALTRRAHALGMQRGISRARSLTRSSVDWHSATSLWPDFAED